MSQEKRAMPAARAELSKSELLLRRLIRPQTYYRAAHALVDRLVTWPAVNATVDARARTRDSDFFFVQIGANDGLRADPINTRVRQQGWHGLLVEPVPRYFKALQTTYADQQGLQFAQVAVSDHDGTATLYAVNPHNTASSMLQGSSSLNRETLGASSWVVRDVESVTEPITVRTQQLATLLGEFGVQEIDYMVVDTEGHDAVIVNQALDLERPPQMILYEHNLLPRGERRNLEARLEDTGYDLRHLRRDTFAWQPDA